MRVVEGGGCWQLGRVVVAAAILSASTDPNNRPQTHPDHPPPPDDYAPPASKAKWFAFFYMCIPTGFALGYVYGGLVAGSMGWRAAFFICGAAMVPFVIFLFCSGPIHLHGTKDIGPGGFRGLVGWSVCWLSDWV